MAAHSRFSQGRSVQGGSVQERRRVQRGRRGHPSLPGWLWLPAALGIAFLLVPIIGMISRIDPGSLSDVIFADESKLAMGLSLGTSLISAFVSVIIGFPLGYLLATRTFRGQRVVRTLILLPLVLPPVVSGLALLYTWGRSALLGSALEGMGLGLAYTTAAVIFAQIFVSMPFMVMSVETAAAARGQNFELAAAELGAKPNRVFFRITLPLLKQGIMTGAVLCFARSLGEFGATLTFAGSLSGVTRTMPLQIYLVRETDPQSAIGLSLLLIVVALIIIVLAYRSPSAPRLRASRGATGPSAAHNEAVEASIGVLRAEAGADAEGRSASPDSTMSIRATLPERGIDVDLTVPAEGTTAIIGRNGAGKSSLLQVMTGAIAADTAVLRIGDDTIVDTAAGVWPPVHDRGIVHLAQNPLLFPHLSVIDNVAFGLRAHGRRSREARTSAQDMLDRLGVGHCSDRRPDAVSGGQAARIALARALVIDPKLLLLDEPLAALDVDVKIETRRVLADVLSGRSAVLITHDVEDVSALASTLVLLSAGTAAYVAPVGEVSPVPGTPGHDFLHSFCETDREGILCIESQ